MSTAELTATTPQHDQDHHAEGHDHPEWLAHHFESPQQQTSAAKLGVWLFLAQEVLFFAGLFAAYAVYRANHPEVFLNAHHYLNPTLGAFNTIVLLASSLAVAWGVRAAQLNDQKTLLWTHIFTLACAGMFMGVKAVEYMYKLYEGLYWAGRYAPDPEVQFGVIQHNLVWTVFWCMVIGVATMGFGWKQKSGPKPGRGWISFSVGAVIASAGAGIVIANGIQAYEVESHMSQHVAAAHGEAELEGLEGIAAAEAIDKAAEAHPVDEHAAEGAEAAPEGEAAEHAPEAPAPAPRVEGEVNAGNFFSIYFAMTGVHALHIIGGILAILWIVGRIGRGDFGPHYFDPVEGVGLYWHLVDLVWIFLFPLLYLIH
ncbi:Cytochrome c oxidase subunit 3 [Pirellulimonas nuda]|uniref:Cytochrome c oxidase subunit 3 n=1 Tax=Pirellulimonas nuda TaxID=2528009 RepID=A0A518DJK7_9BACT|nr:cytochrome c oxidase subunit 3 [Pirellulimonas nuda]QDU91626.1 Cytochrome c oxidase subunit 3 [Pirellulimonas nuda]